MAGPRLCCLILPLAAFTLSACGGGDLTLPPEGQPSKVAMVGGDQQVGPTRTPLPEPLVVRLVDSVGGGIPNRLVTWVVKEGGGTVDPARGTSDADGYASAEWTLGPQEGSNSVEAQVPDVGSVTFTATASGEGGGLEASVDHLTFLVEPPDVKLNQTFTVQVALVDTTGDVVPLSMVFIYLGLFHDGADAPDNDALAGERFHNTDSTGVAEFTLRVQKKGQFRIRALTDDLPELGPHGPEPYLFSRVFRVK